MIVEDGRMVLSGNLIDEFGRFIWGTRLMENGLTTWPIVTGGGLQMEIAMFHYMNH